MINYYKLDFGKLETTPVDLSQLSDVVKMKLVKRIVYDKKLYMINWLKTFMEFRLLIVVI